MGYVVKIFEIPAISISRRKYHKQLIVKVQKAFFLKKKQFKNKKIVKYLYAN